MSSSDLAAEWIFVPAPREHRRIRKRKEKEARELHNLSVKEFRKLLSGNDRLMDLVRFSRGYLLDKKLITHEEYQRLVMDTRSGSADRLNTYDMLIDELEKLRKRK